MHIARDVLRPFSYTLTITLPNTKNTKKDCLAIKTVFFV